MKKELLRDLLKEEGFNKTESTIERYKGRSQHIKFFGNFDLDGLSNKEIVDKWHKFETKYNGLIDIKLDGGLGIELQCPGFLSGEVVLTKEEQDDFIEKYYAELVEVFECSEDESRVTLITNL